LLKKPMPQRFVTGHDFSRADNANQGNGALQAAEKLGGFLGRRIVISF
jgi:hypothetical protein